IFVFLRALASVAGDSCRIIANVLQAEHFTGIYLTGAITADVVVSTIAMLPSSTVNSIFVSNHNDWRLGSVFAPIVAIPLLILSAIFLRKSVRSTTLRSNSIAGHALGIFKMFTFLPP
ncbi:hypothetical protein PENTCL1PPCAC_5468, partial [Pristionchus entomophagus]